jgi:antitoxin component YwqK of YwqJK toxin-antitoxin module
MKERIDRHKDGTIEARGHTVDDVLTGYWEWFRKDGTKMRSGYFENGKQVGEWTTTQGKSRQSDEDEILGAERPARRAAYGAALRQNNGDTENLR